MANETTTTYPRLILGLDVSTACIGASLVLDNGEGTPEVLKITHVSPKVSSKIKGIESLFMKKDIFERDFISTLTESGITDVVIEEPLLSSNNVNTVATLLRFNGMIAESVYSKLHIVPNFISSYDAREFSFPDLVALRKYNKKSEEYPISHIKNAIKNDHLVLFGAYPFDIDKKTLMMDKVNEVYPDIEWILDKNGNLKKENYDACDSLVCALAYININRNGGIEKPTILTCDIRDMEGYWQVDYTTKIWKQTYEKHLTLMKPGLVKKQLN